MEVKSFLGLTGYYWKFVPQYATIATPLSNLLQKGKREKVEWTPECEQAFQTLKLSESLVLIVPDFRRPFVVQTDASNIKIGAVLAQRELTTRNTLWHLQSRKLKPREQNYSAVEKVSSHRVGSAVLLPPLTWLQQMKKENPRLAHWALALQPYKFDVHHRAGAQHKNADGLSRGPPSQILMGEECDEVAQP